jgi:hypothetical protein
VAERCYAAVRENDRIRGTVMEKRSSGLAGKVRERQIELDIDIQRPVAPRCPMSKEVERAYFVVG